MFLRLLFITCPKDWIPSNALRFRNTEGVPVRIGKIENYIPLTVMQFIIRSNKTVKCELS